MGRQSSLLLGIRSRNRGPGRAGESAANGTAGGVVRYVPPPMTTLQKSLAAALLALATGCGGGDDAGPTGPAPIAQRVFLVTCDTLRADRLGVYGYERPTSPRLDELAEGGVVFEEAYAAAPMTTPSVSSLMTGRYVEEVGVFPGNMTMLAPKAETLAERFQAAGIPTAAVVSNWILRKDPRLRGAGVQQGFDHYDDDMRVKERNRRLYERFAPDTTSAAIQWMEGAKERGEDRYFLWVHYQDPHGPYEPPDDLLAEFLRDASGEPALPVGPTNSGEGVIPKYQDLGDERRPSVYRDRYDAEIRAFDRGLGDLVDYLEREGLLEDSLLIFTADHGESLGEHEYYFTHGETVHRELVRVPLIVRYPDAARPPAADASSGVARWTAPVHLVDVFPTALLAMGIDPGRVRGVPLFDGLPRERLVGSSLLPDHGRPRWWSVSDGEWRVVWSDRDGGKKRLYHTKVDPLETDDVSEEHPERVRAMVQGFQRTVAGRPRVEGQGMDLNDPETQRALRQLGYTDGDEPDGGE